jgi:hypothetical protein
MSSGAGTTAPASPSRFRQPWDFVTTVQPKIWEQIALNSGESNQGHLTGAEETQGLCELKSGWLLVSGESRTNRLSRQLLSRLTQHMEEG